MTYFAPISSKVKLSIHCVYSIKVIDALVFYDRLICLVACSASY